MNLKKVVVLVIKITSRLCHNVLHQNIKLRLPNITKQLTFYYYL